MAWVKMGLLHSYAVTRFMHMRYAHKCRALTVYLSPQSGNAARVTIWPSALPLVYHYYSERSSFRSTRSSADADNRLDAFSGQSRSTNMVPFHMLHIVSYCAIVTLSLRRYSSSKNFMTLKWGQRSLKVIESGIIRYVFFSDFVPKMHRF